MCRQPRGAVFRLAGHQVLFVISALAVLVRLRAARTTSRIADVR
ncbi:MAG TPA: hypothetical protein VN969_05030 [Streptosporangiaceae bacterium]|nr:hypothetical protein [Streptosporangiaceae bacterium]